MLFSSISFIYYFLTATILLYVISPKKLKNLVLLLASLVFYAWGEQEKVLIFIGFILAGYILGRLMEKDRDNNKPKLWLTIGTILSIGFIGYFKYTDFAISSVNALLGSDIPLLHIALPIGISFYTFQILSYMIDVYRGDVPAQHNLINFAAYVALFPQLIAGPIVRYKDVAEQLEERTHTIDKTAEGIKRFALGMTKKIIIANQMGALVSSFRASSDLSVLYYWLYAVAYMLQIYFDFSGYSDMAIGLGKIFGFEFMENFNYPFISKSITEFWRRWHISLGSWFRDYVYIPLGGNRKGYTRQIINICIVWALTGLWHGAAWNFVLWGVYFAIILMIEKLFFKKWLDKHPYFGHIYVLALVLVSFVIFNANSFSEIANDLAGMVAFGKLPLVSVESLYMLKSYGVTFVIGFIASTPVLKNTFKKYEERKVMNVLEPLVIVVLLLVCTAYLVDGSFNPFLYFRF